MALYPVTITNGSGSQRLPAGVYSVAPTVTGYTGTLVPATFTATASDGSQSFTLAATGTLTLTITEDGTAEGTKITGGAFIRCNSEGDTTYGTEKTIDALGACTFDHVPYGDETTPYVFYVRQLRSDSTHNIQSGVITVNMAANTQTNYVTNPLAGTQSFTLADAYYSGLNLSGGLDFTGPA